jgi:hypothetical protein
MGGGGGAGGPHPTIGEKWLEVEEDPPRVSVDLSRMVSTNG